MTANSSRASFWQISLTDLEQQVGSGPKGLSPEKPRSALRATGPTPSTSADGTDWHTSCLPIPQSPRPDSDCRRRDLRLNRGNQQLHHHFQHPADERRPRQPARAPGRGGGRSIEGFRRPDGAGLRDGREITIKAEELVPGDLVLLAAGDLVPADGRLLETKDFFVNEALLTGEVLSD